MNIARRPWTQLGSALAMAALFLVAKTARAGGEDGVYGRFDGDLTVRADGGVAFARGGPSLDVGASLVYLSTAGAFVRYEDALGSTAVLARSVAFGVRLEPLFLARYASNLERGPARLDLLLDSFAFELGALWSAPREGGIGARPGAEIAIGLAMPLFADATGPVVGVRGALRWAAEDLPGDRERDVLERGATIAITLGWRHVLRAHLVDAGDRALR